MKITVEISMYPLSKDFIPHIAAFIERLNTYSELQVKTNATSTHIVGEYTTVMTALNKEIEKSFLESDKCIMVMKILNGALAI